MMAKQKEEKADIAFQLRAIELLEAKLNFENSKQEEGRIFNFDIKIENKINPEKGVIFAVNNVSISMDGKSCGSVKVSCVFHIKNFDAFKIDKATGKHAIPSELFTTLNTISISTTRGVMFGYFRGTKLHNAILPVINPAQFMVEKASL